MAEGAPCIFPMTIYEFIAQDKANGSEHTDIDCTRDIGNVLAARISEGKNVTVLASNNSQRLLIRKEGLVTGNIGKGHKGVLVTISG